MTINQIEIEQPPELEHDAMMAAQFGHKLNQRQRIERSIVWNLIRHLKANGFVLVHVYDGEETTKTPDDPLAAMNLCFNLDEVWLRFGKESRPTHVVYMIFGNGNNGLDLTTDHDYSYGDPDGFKAVMDAFDTERFDPSSEEYEPMPLLTAAQIALIEGLCDYAENATLEGDALPPEVAPLRALVAAARKEASNAA